MTLEKPLEIMKFGGTSQGSMKQMERIAEQVKAHVDDGNKVMVVISAPSTKEYRTTDETIKEFERARRGETPRTDEEVFHIQYGYREALGGLKSVRDPMSGRHVFDELLDLMKKGVISIGEEVVDSYRALLYVTGEVYQAAIVAQLFRNHDINADWIDFDDKRFPVRVRGDDMYAFPDLDESQQAASNIDWRERDVYVIPGFGGISKEKNSEKRQKLLGRGGSDTSAFMCLYATGANRCYICTDVDGIKTGPYEGSGLVKTLDVKEASFAGFLKAKLPKPNTVDPLKRTYEKERYPEVRITNAMNIGTGTEIVETDLKGEPVKFIGSRHIPAVYHLSGPAYASVQTALDKIGVDNYTFGSGGGSVRLMIVDGETIGGRKIKQMVNSGNLRIDSYSRDLCVVGAVGNMRVVIGISSRLQAALASHGINMVDPCDQSPCLSAVLVEHEYQKQATRAVYDEFFGR
ncbi:MAG: aspartate kinase [Candidatus Aenigmarchaeota archaeon]|nr:aspartate kinase [Candidatus Aenigmarchaeota archaeon]